MWRSFSHAERKTTLFCLLIVQYMLSDKIKGKSAAKAQTFLLEFMYVIGLVSTENSAGSNIFKTSLAKCLPISSIQSIGILQQWSLTLSQTLNRHASGKD